MGDENPEGMTWLDHLAHGSTSRGWSQLKRVVIDSADPTRDIIPRRSAGRVGRRCLAAARRLTDDPAPRRQYVPKFQCSVSQDADCSWPAGECVARSTSSSIGSGAENPTHAARGPPPRAHGDTAEVRA